MRILIAGLPKSGTTALFHKILHALPEESVGLFERFAYDRAEHGDGRARSVVAKALIQRALSDPADPMSADYFASFADFEHKIHIVRDPRDLLVSALLYGAREGSSWRDDNKVEAFLWLLREKEARPGERARGVSS